MPYGQAVCATFANGDQFGAAVTYDGTVRIYQNGTLLGSISVAGWPFIHNSGYIGISNFDSNGLHLDNFGGGSLPATDFPQTEVLDDFNRANGSLGSGWWGTAGGLLFYQSRWYDPKIASAVRREVTVEFFSNISVSNSQDIN